MTPDETVADWTEGTAGIAYQRCTACGHAWAFRRGFCPACGTADPALLPAAGTGTLHAVTRVARAPSEALRAHAPYCIGLVDLDEGVRVMAHVDEAVAIGERVRVGFFPFGERLVPRFSRA